MKVENFHRKRASSEMLTHNSCLYRERINNFNQTKTTNNHPNFNNQNIGKRGIYANYEAIYPCGKFSLSQTTLLRRYEIAVTTDNKGSDSLSTQMTTRAFLADSNLLPYEISHPDTHPDNRSAMQISAIYSSLAKHLSASIRD